MTADVNVQTANVRAWSAVTEEIKMSDFVLEMKNCVLLEEEGTPVYSLRVSFSVAKF